MGLPVKLKMSIELVEILGEYSRTRIIVTISLIRLGKVSMVNSVLLMYCCAQLVIMKNQLFFCVEKILNLLHCILL